MQIRTDINEIINNTYQGVKRPRPLAKTGPPVKPAVQKDSRLFQSITSRLQSERTLSEALSIAQTSQSLIQKAMIISSRLRNIASQALSDGTINNAELDVAINEINSAFSGFNKGLAAPVNLPVERGTESLRLPGIEEDISGIQNYASALQQGTIPDAAVIDELAAGLDRKAALYGEAVDAMGQRLSGIAENYTAGNFSGAAGLENLRNSIINEPAGAVAAQGNLSHDAAQKILQG